MPDLLLLSPVLPALAADLARLFTVHGPIHADGLTHYLTKYGTRIEAVMTSGPLGVPDAVVAALPRLRIIAINGVGYDRVNLNAARARGIRVTNTPDVLTDDVADLAIGLTIAVMRQLTVADRYVRAGSWTQGNLRLARRMSGKRYGILGLGRIGAAVAARLVPFGGTIGYSARAPKQVPYQYYPDTLSLARASDVLIVCADASPATRHTVDRAALDALGPAGVLVNIARGALVDEPALVAALVEGRLGGAGLDVFADEPNVPATLLTLDTVVLAPHIASATEETRAAMGQLALDNLVAFFAGSRLPTPVV